MGDELELAYDAFNGSDAHVAVLIRLIKERLQILQHGDRWKVAVACDAVASVADVVVEANGNVRGLKVPMQLPPDSAAQLLKDPVAWAGFVAEKDGLRLIVHHLHVISVISAVPGVPAMVIRVMPAPHGKATDEVNAEIERLIGLLNANGLSVELVCTDGDSTYVRKLTGAFAMVGVPDSYDLKRPLHRQLSLRARIAMPGSFTCWCIDIDHQGKGMRDLYVKGEWMVVFPQFAVDCPECATHVDVLVDVGAAPHLLRDFTGGKMDDVLASKVWSGPILIEAGEKLHCSIALVDARTPPQEGMSENDLADLDRSEREDEESMRHLCAACWLHVVWVCVYQTMHGGVDGFGPPPSRLLWFLYVARYGHRASVHSGWLCSG